MTAITPEQLCKSGSEHGEQMALFCWFGQVMRTYPGEFDELKWAHSIPNGGARTPSVAAALKAEGVKSGISDICLPVSRHGYHGFYLELKKRAISGKQSAGAESKEQKEFGAFLTEQGYLYKCCFGWIDAAQAISWYMGIVFNTDN